MREAGRKRRRNTSVTRPNRPGQVCLWYLLLLQSHWHYSFSEKGRERDREIPLHSQRHFLNLIANWDPFLAIYLTGSQMEPLRGTTKLKTACEKKRQHSKPPMTHKDESRNHLWLDDRSKWLTKDLKAVSGCFSVTPSMVILVPFIIWPGTWPARLLITVTGHGPSRLGLSTSFNALTQRLHTTTHK